MLHVGLIGRLRWLQEETMRKLTCYAWGKPGDWEAICVDLDIPAQGESFEQVRDELTAAVEDFLDYAAELPKIDRQAVLNRRVPWWLRLQLFLQYRWFTCVSAFNPFTGGGQVVKIGETSRAEFVVNLA